MLRKKSGPTRSKYMTLSLKIILSLESTRSYKLLRMKMPKKSLLWHKSLKKKMRKSKGLDKKEQLMS